MVKFMEQEEDYSIIAQLQVVGPDLIIQITGGDHPHIGTVSTLTHDTEVKTIRFPSHDGRFHKDYLLSDPIAKIIRPYLTGSCTITAGVHVDHISKKQIAAAGMMTERLGKKLADWLAGHPNAARRPIYYDKNEAPQ